jgi:hypothetical protein
MKPSKTAGVLAIIAAVAWAVGVAWFVLDDTDESVVAGPESGASSQSAAERTVLFSSFAPRDHIDRFAFVPTGSIGATEPPAPPPQLHGSLRDEPATTWSAETQRLASAPVTVALPGDVTRGTIARPERLPWLGQAPAKRLRYYTLKQRLAELAPTATWRLAAKFEAAKAAWPPSDIALVAIKDEKSLELHARSGGSGWKLVHRYKVLAASGGAGPKLKQGDRQVPEGVYSIALLNPNSQYHVSLRVNYPNAFDKQMAAADGRKDLGGDIMIHGKNLSAGCLAVGDEAAEELFVLAAQVGLSHVKVVIAPTDFRLNGVPSIDPAQPGWLPKLYTEVASAMADFKAPTAPKTGLMSLFGN